MTNTIDPEVTNSSIIEMMALGGMPTATACVVKSHLPIIVKAAGLAVATISTAFLAFQAPHHEHPSIFCHPQTQQPLKQGDRITVTDAYGNEVSKMVVGYTGHHHTVFDTHALAKDDEGNILLAKMDAKTLWTGPYSLVASTYAAKPDSKAALVVADAKHPRELYQYDLSGDGPFQSFAAQALAVSVKGQKLLNVEVLKPTTLENEHKTGMNAQIRRLFDSLKTNPQKAINPSVLRLAQHIHYPGHMNPLDFTH